MSVFESLTKHLHSESSLDIDKFIDDVYAFIDTNPKYELNKYIDILKANNIEWGNNEMQIVDVSELDESCMLALIVGAVRAERFCDGALLLMFRNGLIEKWLLRLKELGNNTQKGLD